LTFPLPFINIESPQLGEHWLATVAVQKTYIKLLQGINISFQSDVPKFLAGEMTPIGQNDHLGVSHCMFELFDILREI
jgi:hypothetical protein